MQTLKKQINEIMKKNAGEIYTAQDFKHIASKNTIASILSQLAKEGEIERLINGLYTRPYYIDLVDRYSYPNPEQVAKKIAQKNGWTIAPAREATLNYTGVSTQVPVIFEYISDGPSKVYIYRKRKITFINRPKNYISTCSRRFAILVEAIRWLGRKYINNNEIRDLAFYARDVQEDLLKDTKDVSFWIRNVLLKIKEINDNR
ncbi:DUF6088 family protein [Mycoplasmopsis citelli]|uniref:DUF6088 family protein n=1 Tax=Mycoplasmopsis citelli TaxID=171281 RepID=UPI002115C16D|nr:DUF6088 family protein [Mycoplasmopsis citelli]UUD35838.1 DUF6088 family protein [Mycoplasmopsis citelli]